MGARLAIVLTELRISNFKSYGAEQKLSLAPLTLLVGANASGKSNVIEALALLSWMARGRRLSELGYALQQRELHVRGRPETLVATAGSALQLGAVVDGLELSVGLELSGSGGRIVSEQLADPSAQTKLPLYRVERASSEHGSELSVGYNNFSRGRIKPQIGCVDTQAVFTQLLTPARFDAEHAESQRQIPEACTKVADALTSLVMLDPRPDAMRSYAFAEDRRLFADGSNVSAVLAQLCGDEAARAEVLRFVRNLPEQDIAGIEFLRGPRNDVMVELVESFGGKTSKVDATMLSDGTLRVLAIAAALLSVEEGTLVVIGEIDNGVHPSRARELMRSLEETARRRGLRLLVTTHNPALLDAVPPSALGDTVACYRDPATGESRLQTLREMDDFVAIGAAGPLGMLATSGALDRYLKRRRSAQVREAQGQQILELLRSGE